MASNARPHIKRTLRDRLLAWPAGTAIELQGPVGAGKRTLAQRLGHLEIYTSHRRVLAHERPTRHVVRIHPFTVAELGIQDPSAFEQLLNRGGLASGLWSPSQQQNPLETLLVAPSSELGALRRASSIERLWHDLMARVGRTLSIRALAQQWGISDRLARGMITTIEAHHGLFRLQPLPSPTGGVSFRALKKDQKAYPYDWSGAHTLTARVEALVINHLLQWVESEVDLQDRPLALHYFRDCDQREVDAVVLERGQPMLLVQLDPRLDRPNRHLAYLKRKFPNAAAWHLSLEGSLEPELHQGIYMAHPLALLRPLA